MELPVLPKGPFCQRLMNYFYRVLSTRDNSNRTIPLKAEFDRNFRIIVADDDDDDQYLIEQALRETLKSHSLKTVNNGLELVDLLFNGEDQFEDGLPDFILLDLNMPLLDGFSVLEQVRSNEFTKKIPVYVLTTSRFETDRKKSHEMGANGFYSKPYQFEQLKGIIRSICAANANQA
jgi:CheY-like chemotaxis protein